MYLGICCCSYFSIYKIKQWCIAKEYTALCFPTRLAEPTFEFTEHAGVASSPCTVHDCSYKQCPTDFTH